MVTNRLDVCRQANSSDHRINHRAKETHVFLGTVKSPWNLLSEADSLRHCAAANTLKSFLVKGTRERAAGEMLYPRLKGVGNANLVWRLMCCAD